MEQIKIVGNDVTGYVTVGPFKAWYLKTEDLEHVDLAGERFSLIEEMSAWVAAGGLHRKVKDLSAKGELELAYYNAKTGQLVKGMDNIFRLHPHGAGTFFVYSGNTQLLTVCSSNRLSHELPMYNIDTELKEEDTSGGWSQIAIYVQRFCNKHIAELSEECGVLSSTSFPAGSN